MFDSYRHLDKDAAPAPFDMDQIAEWAVNQNYGGHRMTCALAKAIENHWNRQTELAIALRSAAENFLT